MRSCSVCDKPLFCKGYCSRHYYQSRVYGDIPERTRQDRNKIISNGSFGYIEMYNSDKYKYAVIDADKINLIKNYKWWFNYYGYVVTQIKRKTCFLHHFILPKLEGYIIDHKNRKKYDNRKSNLRYATYSQNGMNKTVVGIVRSQNKWQPQIVVNRKYIWLGRYDSFDEAFKVRKEAEQKYFGEFAPC